MVLWTLLLLSFLAATFGGNARTEIYLARNLVENSQAEALADAGIYRAIAGLTKEPAEGGFRGDGEVYNMRTDAGEIRFSIRDDGGKVDLNLASALLLRELFVAVGVKEKESAALADAIVDFRDDDDTKLPHGAEARDYAAARIPYGPKNQNFALVDELIYVYGMTPEIYRTVAPLLTVHGQETPHIPTAAPEVRAAMEAMAEAPSGSAAGSSGSSASSSGGGRAGEGSSGRAFGKSTGSSSGSSFGGGSSRSGSSGSSAFGSGSSGRSSFGSSGSSGSSAFGSGSSGRSSFGSRSGLGSSSSTGEGLFGDGSTGDDESAERDRSDVPVFTVHAEGRTPGGTVFARDAIVDFSAADENPFALHAWRRGERRLFPPDGVSPAVEPAAR